MLIKHSALLLSILAVTTAACLPGCDQSDAVVTPESPVAPRTPDQVTRSHSKPRNQTRRETREELGQAIRDAELSVLFIGNSHIVPMPNLLKSLSDRRSPERKVVFRRVSRYGFLVDHAGYQPTLDMIAAGPWDVVVLQAQKYSTTGRYHYPCDGALALSERAADVGAKVVMFPEWSQQGNPDEYLRINKVHQEIAEQTGATVAPVGEAWHRAMQQLPQVNLYYVDGNHANETGNWLTACVLYAVLTGENPAGDPPVESNEEAAIKSRLAELAWEVVSQDP